MPTIIRSRGFGSSAGGVSGGESSIGVDAVECPSSDVAMPSPCGAVVRFVVAAAIFPFGSGRELPSYRRAHRETWFRKDKTDALGSGVELERSI